MSINPTLDAARAHFTASLTTLQSIEVPEWGTTIYWAAPTLSEREIYATTTNDVALAREILLQRARDENGAKIFSAADREQLARAVDSYVIERIVDAIAEWDHELRESEAERKN